MDLIKKSIFILGAGITGITTAKKAVGLGCKVFIYDDVEKNINKELQELKIQFKSYNQINWQQIDYIIVSPGINLSGAKAHKIKEISILHNKMIISDVELFSYLVPKAQLIAITGTNGKSTTSSLIYHILKKSGKEVYLGGNIGTGVFDLPIKNQQNIFYILELSSYQLELLNKMKFDVGVILNITPDHINRHGSFASYVAAKFNIFKNLKASSLAIISKYLYNLDFTQKHLQDKRILPFAIADLNNYEITKNYSSFGNKENIEAVIEIANFYNIAKKDIEDALNNFQSLPHRLQYLGKINNISIYNDSKATNAESTANAIKQFNNSCLIMGGIAKAEGIKAIIPYLDKIEHIFLIGDATKLFKSQLDAANYKKYVEAASLLKAYQGALDFCENYHNDIALIFSPAAASFDMWSNFEERGDEFMKLFKNNIEQ